MTADQTDRSAQDDIDTREVTPQQRARRNRTYGALLVVALCAAAFVGGYTVGRGRRPRRRDTLVESETEPQRPAPRTTAPPEPTPPPPPLARLAAAEATLENTRVGVRFAAAVDREAAEKTGSYTIEPDVMIIAAELADDGRTVILTTEPLEHDTDYTVTVSGIAMAAASPADRRATFRYLGTRRVTDGLVVLYTLEEGEGEVVRDTSRVGEPLDLRVRDPEKTRWTPGGLEVNDSTLIHGEGTAAKIIDACKAANALTIEAWLAPDHDRQGGPARIVTLSRGASDRNFTLGQEGRNYIVRLRTTERDANGEPLVPTSGGVAETLTHLVYTRAADGKVALWVNGELNAAATVPGDLSNWAAFPFALANEFDTDRTWLGQLHLVALYARALTAAEVQQNFKAGPEGKTAAAGAAAE